MALEIMYKNYFYLYNNTKTISMLGFYYIVGIIWAKLFHKLVLGITMFNVIEFRELCLKFFIKSESKEII